MTVQSSTPKLLVHPVGQDQYKLSCPVCGRESEEVLPWPEVQALAWSGQGSVCIDCDPAATEPTPYRPIPPLDDQTAQIIQQAINALYTPGEELATLSRLRVLRVLEDVAYQAVNLVLVDVVGCLQGGER